MAAEQTAAHRIKKREEEVAGRDEQMRMLQGKLVASCEFPDFLAVVATAAAAALDFPDQFGSFLFCFSAP